MCLLTPIQLSAVRWQCKQRANPAYVVIYLAGKGFG
jgi:hypothetical protein